VLPADRLDHLDRGELGVAAAQVAVVLEHDLHAAVEARLAHAPRGHRVLLARQRGGGHPAAVVARRVQCERSPAGPDLHEVVRRLELELAADHVELRLLRLAQRRLGCVEHRARVGHGLVEEEREQVVSQVVVGGRLDPRAGARVAPRPRGQRVSQRRERSAQPVEPDHLAPRDPHERDEVVAVPGAGGVRLAEPAAAATCHGAPERRVVHGDGRGELRTGRAERAPRIALDHVDPPGAQPPEQAVHERAGDHRAGCGW
jgi:hypothetical protein